MHLKKFIENTVATVARNPQTVGITRFLRQQCIVAVARKFFTPPIFSANCTNHASAGDERGFFLFSDTFGGNPRPIMSTYIPRRWVWYALPDA